MTRVVAIFTGTRSELTVNEKSQVTKDLATHVDLRTRVGPCEIYVGDCPSGLDRYVRSWLGDSPCMHVFQAFWASEGRGAGPRRNARMVGAAHGRAAKLGIPLVCYAYPRGRSPGTRDCMRRAEAAGAEMRGREL